MKRYKKGVTEQDFRCVGERLICEIRDCESVNP